MDFPSSAGPFCEPLDTATCQRLTTVCEWRLWNWFHVAALAGRPNNGGHHGLRTWNAVVASSGWDIRQFLIVHDLVKVPQPRPCRGYPPPPDGRGGGFLHGGTNASQRSLRVQKLPRARVICGPSLRRHDLPLRLVRGREPHHVSFPGHATTAAPISAQGLAACFHFLFGRTNGGRSIYIRSVERSRLMTYPLPSSSRGCHVRKMRRTC